MFKSGPDDDDDSFSLFPYVSLLLVQFHSDFVVKRFRDCCTSSVLWLHVLHLAV